MIPSKTISGLSLLCALFAGLPALAEGPARAQAQAVTEARPPTGVDSIKSGGERAAGESGRQDTTMLPAPAQSRPAATKAIQLPAASGVQMPALGLCDGS